MIYRFKIIIRIIRNIKYCIFLIIFFKSVLLKAQVEVKYNDIDKFKKNSIFPEVGGWSRFYSINYGRIVYRYEFIKINVSGGFSYSVEHRRTQCCGNYELEYYIVPISSVILLGEKNHYFEIGLCVTPYYHQDSVVLNFNYTTKTWELKKSWILSYKPFAVIGYRYESWGGFLFRFTILPILSNDTYWDFTESRVGFGIGISIGFAF